MYIDGTLLHMADTAREARARARGAWPIERHALDEAPSEILRDAKAEFVIVGAHALAAHGLPRATGDLDILVRPDSINAHRVFEALAQFGAAATR
jgi:hypothetical protein